MYCIHCGTALPDHAKFCRNCGESIEVDNSEASQTSEKTESHHSISLEKILQKAVVIDSNGMDNDFIDSIGKESIKVDTPSQINPDFQLEELKAEVTKNPVSGLIGSTIGIIFGVILSISDQEEVLISGILIIIVSLTFLVAFIIQTSTNS